MVLFSAGFLEVFVSSSICRLSVHSNQLDDITALPRQVRYFSSDTVTVGTMPGLKENPSLRYIKVLTFVYKCLFLSTK